MIKKLILSLIFMFALPCYSAEFLIMAKRHWMDTILKTKWEQCGITQDKFNMRSEKGDIIVVKPNGFIWGKSECLPDFVIVKVPNLLVEKCYFLAYPLMNEISKEGKTISILKKVRTFRLPIKTIDQIINKGGISKMHSEVFINNLRERKLNTQGELGEEITFDIGFN